MRISGLATGMDTESIIRDMMKAQRIPLDKITQKKQQLEWQLDSYRSINRNLLTMQHGLRDTVNRQSTFIAKTVSVSKPDVVGVRALNATSDFSGTIEVHRLAKNATMQSEKFTDLDLNAKFSEQLPKPTLPSSIRITAIQADGKFDVNRAAAPPETKDYKAGYEVIINADSTMQSVIDDINTNSDVTAFYDSFQKQIVFTAKNSGQDQDIDGKEMQFEFLGANGQVDPTAVNFLKVDLNNSASGTRGVNADFTFNGLKTERSSNTFQINGFEINLKQVTEVGATPVTFSSTADVDKVLEAVVKFVDDYNKMIEELNAKIREPKYRGYQPLSAEEKKDLKEKEIELWEEKAKSGSLKNDPAITSMLSNLRNIMNSSIEGSDGKKMSLRDFGITTSKDYLENGKLVIDESKLRTAIAEDPNKLYELIGKSNDTNPKNAGLSHQYRKVLESSGEIITERAGSTGSVNDTFTLGLNLKDMNKQIERFENRLKMTEDRLWKQFSAMESAIQRMNAQSANLMSQFGG